MVKSYTLRLRTVIPYRETGNAKLASHLNLAAIWSSHNLTVTLTVTGGSGPCHNRVRAPVRTARGSRR